MSWMRDPMASQVVLMMEPFSFEIMRASLVELVDRAAGEVTLTLDDLYGSDSARLSIGRHLAILIPPTAPPRVVLRVISFERATELVQRQATRA